MKASSKAAKQRAKRGRPRLPPSDRETNGRHSRRKASQNHRANQDMENIMDAAVTRRIRHDNLVDFKAKDGKVVTARQQALDPRRGYVLGLMLLDGTINQRQHDAGVKYAEDMARYYGLTGVQFPSARAQDLFAVRSDGDEPAHKSEAAAAARERMKKLEKILLETGDINTGRKVAHTVSAIAVQDIAEARTWPGHMIGWLKRGLNQVANYYQIPEGV